MSRGRKRTNMKTGQASSSKLRPAVPALTIEEGRQRLHSIAGRFNKLTKPSGSLLDRAQSVGSYRKGGLLLVPEIDALAEVERLEEARRENEELLDELEDMGIILLAQERLAEPTPVDQLIPLRSSPASLVGSTSLPAEPYVVRAEPEVSDDLQELLKVDEELVDEAIRRMASPRRSLARRRASGALQPPRSEGL